MISNVSEVRLENSLRRCKIAANVLIFAVLWLSALNARVVCAQSATPGASQKDSVELSGHFDGQSVWQFRVPCANGYSNAYLWIPPKCKKVRAIIIGTTIVIEKALLEDPVIRKMAEEEDIAEVWFNKNWCNNFDYSEKSQAPALLEKALQDLAGVCGYPEIAWAPLVTIGHSASGPFAYNVAYWKPERVLAIISAKAGYVWPPNKTTTLRQTPVLIHGGQIFEISSPYSANADIAACAAAQAAGHCRNDPDPGRVCVGITEVGSGHFEWTPKMAVYTAEFIRAAARARLPASVDPGYKFRPVDPKSLWMVDSSLPVGAPAAPALLYRGNKPGAMRVFNQSLALAAQNYAKEDAKKKPQWLAFEGVTPNPKGMTEIPFTPVEDGMTFTVKAKFLDVVPAGLPGAGTPLGHAKGGIQLRVAGWGWSCEQLGPEKFRIRFNRAEDKIDNIIILAYHPGDGEYRPVVQPGFIKIPEKNKMGKPQKITFSPIGDQVEGAKELTLNAVSDSGLPVEYFVKSGPAVIQNGNRLVFTPIPLNAKFPVEVTVVAYQWGRSVAPQVQSAANVLQTFKIVRK